MAILSNVFGNDDGQSSNSSNGESAVDGMLNTAADAGVDYETNSESMNEDGETSSSSNDGSLGTDLNSDSLLGGSGSGSSDSMSETESN
jgi:hypothetical protein